MKTTRLFLIVAAITMLTTSCEELLDSLSKNPVFEFTGSTVYDGQTAFLGTTATCKIGWTNHNPEIVDLSYNATRRTARTGSASPTRRRPKP